MASTWKEGIVRLEVDKLFFCIVYALTEPNMRLVDSNIIFYYQITLSFLEIAFIIDTRHKIKYQH